MWKATVVRAVLCTLALSSLPAVAATISPGEIKIRLEGAECTGMNRFLLQSGNVVIMDVNAGAGDLLFVFAVALDTLGEADYSVILPLYVGASADGHVLESITVPAASEGMTFLLQAVSLDSIGAFHSSEPLTVDVGGRQVLYPPPFDPAHRGAKAILLDEG